MKVRPMKVRPAALRADLVQEGDILLNVPWINMTARQDMATVLGVVLTVRKMDDGTPSWLIRTPSGSVIEHPAEGPMVNTYVHVPVRSVMPTVDQANFKITPEDARHLMGTLSDVDTGVRCRCPTQCGHGS